MERHPESWFVVDAEEGLSDLRPVQSRPWKEVRFCALGSFTSDILEVKITILHAVSLFSVTIR